MNFLLENDEYTVSGYYEFIGKMSSNTMITGFRGPTTIKFKDGSTIKFNAPDIKLGGMVMGARTIECTGSLVFHDIANKLKGVVIFGTFKESGFWEKTITGSKANITGLIYRLSDKNNIAPVFGKSQKLPTDLKDLKDIEKSLCEIGGGYLSEITFDKRSYWNINTTVPARQIPQTISQP